ncbi:MAG: hypothetical protein AMXMBFR83_07650 [Phycisphaerae bacterium]
MATAVTDRHSSTGMETTGPARPPRREAPALCENALRVLRARYLKKDESGKVIETPEELFTRVARTMADVELLYDTQRQRDEWEERFYNLMVSGRFMPNSPTLMNAGREMGMLSACFVLPVRDSINDIFDSIKHTAIIQKAGGGTGFAFDELRPTGDYIKSSGGTTSGPITFWRAFSETTNAIQQGAFRRGANMGMMNIHHPDILKFLHAKQDLSQFTNYNISVKITDEWMHEFLRDPLSPHVVRNPRTGREYVLPRDLGIWEYDIRSLIPVRRGPDGVLRAAIGDDPDAGERIVARGSSSNPPLYTKKDIWDFIVRNAHATGEPGVVFIDRINQYNPTPHLGRMEATNPCGEQPLLPYEACNLGSVNLSKFVLHPLTPRAEMDWDALRDTVRESTRFLDNVIDANNYQLPQIDEICKGNRKIGLGIMGFAETLYMLGVRYASEEGVAWGERLMRFVNDESHAYSEHLAHERGCFPNWKGSIWDTKYHRPMRNACCTTVAPTGTISIIAGCSGGIEPMFSLVFYRNVLKGQDEGKTPMVQVDPTFERVARERGFYSEGLMDQIARDGTLAHIESIPEDVRHVFVCAHDVSPEWHVRMQAAFQRHCDSSISKTINFPHDARVEDVETIYRMAFELGCKGVTVYRDGCRAEQPMALKDSQKKHEAGMAAAGPADHAGGTLERSDEQPELEPHDIPEIVSGLRIRQLTPFGNMHVKITVDPKTGRDLEVFAQLGKGGDLANSDLEAICRLISLWLRAGGTLKHVIRQLKDIGSSLQVPTRDGKIMSLGDGLSRALMRYQRAKERFGLKALLLGDYSLADLDRPGTGPAKSNGNGHKNGKGQPPGNGNGHGSSDGHERVPEVRHAARTAHAGLSGGAPGETEGPGAPQPARLEFKVVCPECGDGLIFGEGCNKCPTCGWAQC